MDWNLSRQTDEAEWSKFSSTSCNFFVFYFLSVLKKYRCFWSKLIQLSHSCSLILLYLTLRNLSPIPYFTTSLIQACKILTVLHSLFTIHPPSFGVPIFISNLCALDLLPPSLFTLTSSSQPLAPPDSSYLSLFLWFISKHRQPKWSIN